VSVAGLVLAAGEGRRFGGPKAVATIDDERFVDRAVRILRAGSCAPVVVVSGAVELEVEGAQVVANPAWASGMGSSLRSGLAGLAGTDASAVVVLLVDTPWVSPDAVRRLATEAGASPAAIATYDGRRGHPVLLSRSIWPAVAELAVGDVAAKAWLGAHPDQVLEVDCTGLGDPRDVDTPDQLAGPSRTAPSGVEE
jgi:nicotine blue oxidoreductase